MALLGGSDRKRVHKRKGKKQQERSSSAVKQYQLRRLFIPQREQGKKERNVLLLPIRQERQGEDGRRWEFGSRKELGHKKLGGGGGLTAQLVHSWRRELLEERERLLGNHWGQREREMSKNLTDSLAIIEQHCL
jgi:hypothetical protein